MSAGKTAEQLFHEDRTAEILHFVDEMKKEYLDTGKCTQTQWKAIIRNVVTKFMMTHLRSFV